MTLKTICQAALEELGTFDVPETFFNNTNDTARQCRALANAVGKSLQRDYVWEILQSSHTFATVASTASYALPSDFGKFSNLTFWDRLNYWQINGPATAAEWQYLNSALIETTPRRWFRIAGGLFYVYPTPTDVATIAYDYQSKDWCEDSGATGQNAFVSDDDVPRLDEELIKLGVKYRFLSAKGLPYGEEKEDYEQFRNSLLADDGAKPEINFSPTPRKDNFPITGFGSLS